MGFVLFEESGTFNPLDWGLSVGDMLTLVVVGGGGGGAGVTGTNGRVEEGKTAAGNNGGTSSFGNILSALGGAGGPRYKTAQSKQGQMMAADGYIDSVELKNCYGSAGGGGYWFDPSIPTQRAYGDTSSQNLGGRYVFNTGNDSENYNNNPALGIGGPQGKGGKPGGTYDSNGLAGPGGGGYGGGGGGALKVYVGRSDIDTSYSAALLGGNSGQVQIATHKLTSVNAVAVTVGVGGTGGGASLYSNGRTVGGDGASGCVAVFW